MHRMQKVPHLKIGLCQGSNLLDHSPLSRAQNISAGKLTPSHGELGQLSSLVSKGLFSCRSFRIRRSGMTVIRTGSWDCPESTLWTDNVSVIEYH